MAQPHILRCVAAQRGRHTATRDLHVMVEFDLGALRLVVTEPSRTGLIGLVVRAGHDVEWGLGE